MENYISIVEVESALQYISADDRAVWVKIGKVLHEEFGETAFSVWDDWSRRSESYEDKASKNTWKSITRMNGAGKPATIASIFYEAKKSGWVQEKKAEPNQDAIKNHKKERAARKEAQDKLTQERANRAGLLAREIWDSSVPASDDHPYLLRKNVAAYGLRQAKVVQLEYIDKNTGEIKQYAVKNALIIPVFASANSISSLQIINADGQKHFMLDGAIAGGYTKIGEINKQTQKIIFCEGWATGASIFLATKTPVVVAFNAGNLKPVIEKIKKALPDVDCLIAADNDQFTEKNTGIIAAKATGVPFIAPEFTNLTGEPTDFNDLHVLEGILAVEKAFSADRTPAKVSEVMHVDTISPLPNLNDKGRPLGTIDNVGEICRRLNITLRYNMISKEEEILIPGESFIDDVKDNSIYAYLESWCAQFGVFPGSSLAGYITYLAGKNLYNPVSTWILSKKWDGVSRLNDLYNTVQVRAEDEDFKNLLIKKWLISAVAAAFSPNGINAGGILVFQGAQNAGKTEWFKSLAPENLNVLKDSMLLKPDNKDSVIQVCSFWLVELGEIDATFKKSDISALKAFLSNKKDILRRPFARKNSHYARRTVFFGSVNILEFLRDETGNRRYWTIECLKIIARHGIDMQQLWAEVHEIYDTGESYYLTQEENALLTNSNKKFDSVNSIDELIQSKLNWESDQLYWSYRTVTDVLHSLGIVRPTQLETNRASHAIRELNQGQCKRTSNARLVFVPNLIIL